MIGGFVHPLLALGALLAAVPLIIHLLNRQRHKPLRWGAMRFVEAAYRRTRRRTRFENLILLLLRMLGVALLALALARPFAGERSPLAPLTESRRDVVLLLDTSASTGYREPTGSVFERLTERAREILSELDGGRGDRARLIVADERPRLLSWRSPQDALSLLATLDRPSDGAMDLAGALAVALESLEEDGSELAPGRVELRLLTDLQRRSFVGPPAEGTPPDARPAGGVPPADGSDPDRTDADAATAKVDGGAAGVGELRSVLDRLAERELALVVEDLGGGELLPGNLGVVEVAPLEELLGPDLPVDVRVTVANHGGEEVTGVRLALVVDGDRLPSRTLDIAPGATREEVFTLVFDAPGPHVLEAALEVDRLEFDDRRVSVLEVPDALEVLLVNGDPDASAIDRDEVGLLAAALSPPSGPGDGGFAPFVVDTVDPAALDDPNLELARHQVVVLANVETLSTRAVERLTDHVAGGAGLIVTLGDRVSPADYARRLFAADGSGLLPAEPLEVVSVPSRRDGYFRVADFDGEHPALEFFDDMRWRPLLTEVPIYSFVAVEPLPDARVLAELDSGGAPLLVERAFGAGRVLLWTSSIDADWNRVPESASTLIPLTHELVRHAGRGRVRPTDVSLGAPLEPIFDRFPRDPVLVTADGLRRPIAEEPVELGGGRWTLPGIDETRRAGLVEIEVEGRVAARFSVQADPAEGRLARLAPGELEALHPALRVARPEADADDLASDAPRGELWRGLAWIALLLLAAESLWSAWLGRRRSLA